MLLLPKKEYNFSENIKLYYSETENSSLCTLILDRIK